MGSRCSSLPADVQSAIINGVPVPIYETNVIGRFYHWDASTSFNSVYVTYSVMEHMGVEYLVQQLRGRYKIYKFRDANEVKKKIRRLNFDYVVVNDTEDDETLTLTIDGHRAWFDDVFCGEILPIRHPYLIKLLA